MSWRRSNAALTNDYKRQPNTLRESEAEVAHLAPAVGYGRCVGGGTVHFTGNYWRFHEIDFIEASRKGAVSGAARRRLAAHLRRARAILQQSGVGDRRVGPGRREARSIHRAPDPIRCHPYRLSPKACSLSAPQRSSAGPPSLPQWPFCRSPIRGRSACINCGFCEYFGCEMEAKSSTLVSMIPDAVATGRCEIRPDSYVRKIEVTNAGSGDRSEVLRCEETRDLQKARAVVISANGAETPRLLLQSEVETLSPWPGQRQRHGGAQSDVQQRGVCGWAVRG